MTRLNMVIFGISELKWTGMGKLNPMTITSTIVTIVSTSKGKNPLEEIEYPLESTKESERQFFGSISKMTE